MRQRKLEIEPSLQQDGYGMSEHYYLTLQFYQPVRVENIM